jgi:hypothetical protein
MIQSVKTDTYDTDYYQWTLEQVQALRERNLEAIDWENMIEEIETLGRSNYSVVFIILRRQIEHRLKIDYANRPEHKNHWTIEGLTFKKNLKKRISPSMKPKLEADLPEIYQDAVELVLAKYNITLPPSCPYSLDELS